MTSWELLCYGLLPVLLAARIAYPFSMNYAHPPSSFVFRRLSHEAIIVTVGLLSRRLGFDTGGQSTVYYLALLSVPALTKLIA